MVWTGYRNASEKTCVVFHLNPLRSCVCGTFGKSAIAAIKCQDVLEARFGVRVRILKCGYCRITKVPTVVPRVVEALLSPLERFLFPNTEEDVQTDKLSLNTDFVSAD